MRYLRFLFPLFAVWILSGCIRENLETCWNVELYYRCDFEGKDLFRKNIQKLNLYVFDAENRLVLEKECTVSDLGADNRLPKFRLQPGRYTVVTLGNQLENTVVTGLDHRSLKEIFFQHPNTDNDREIRNYDRNYLGLVTFDLGAVTTYRDTVDMQLSHVNLHVEVTGIRESSASATGTRNGSSPYVLKIENVNLRTDFTNEVSTGLLGTCHPEQSFDSGKGILSTGEVTLFRLDRQCRHEINLYDKEDSLIVSVPLKKFLSDNPDLEDFLNPDIDIPMEIAFSDLGVTVKVPDWAIVDVRPEL